MDPSALQIEALLSELADEHIVFVPNPGNAGDSLIAHATYDLLQRHGISFSILPYGESGTADLGSRTVVYGGGGTFNRLFDSAARFVEGAKEAARQLIVLPQTVDGHENLLRALGRNVFLLCRERVSFEHARTHIKEARLGLAHDVALTLDIAATLARPPGPAWWWPTRRRWVWNELRLRFLLRRKDLYDRRRDSHGVLNCFRGGPDRPDTKIPSDNIDISALIGRGVHPEPVAASVASRLLRFLSRYEVINTNRLHVGIAGCLLRKVVRLYPNTYFKNQAVYEFSLKPRFPQVTWMGT